jgi:hypothetical protein
MDASRFDDLLRALASAASRRRFVAALPGGLVAIGALLPSGEDAAAGCNKRCGQCKRCKSGRCRPRQNGTACKNDSTRQCCDGKCCERGDICVRGKCVTGQGTCADGEDTCDVASSSCNGVAEDECTCVQTTSGATRCAANERIGDCGECQDDAFCKQTYGPTAFCADIGHGACGCKPPADGPAWCMRPCPF